MEFKKENVVKDFENMILKSWTFEKMTQLEKVNVLEAINSERTQKALKGTYKARWSILQAIYNSFLLALNYEDFRWRE